MPDAMSRDPESVIVTALAEWKLQDQPDKPRAVVERLLGEFGAALTQEIRDGIAAKGLSIDEAVIIASIVEREAVIDEERPLDDRGEAAARLPVDVEPQHGAVECAFALHRRVAYVVDQQDRQRAHRHVVERVGVGGYHGVSTGWASGANRTVSNSRMARFQARHPGITVHFTLNFQGRRHLAQARQQRTHLFRRWCIEATE